MPQNQLSAAACYYWSYKMYRWSRGAQSFQECISCLKIHGDMQLVPYWEPTNIRHHCTKFGPHDGLPPRICASLP